MEVHKGTWVSSYKASHGAKLSSKAAAMGLKKGAHAVYNDSKNGRMVDSASSCGMNLLGSFNENILIHVLFFNLAA